MTGYLIAEEGPLSGLIIRLVEGDEWTIGRDPDISFQVLEDPMVSRKHVLCRLTGEGYVIENLSSTNPATVNGKVVTEPTLLQEGDTVQIGNTFFRFSEKDPSAEPFSSPPSEGEGELLGDVSEPYEEDLFFPRSVMRWMLKVIAGPNSGAEFGMEKGKSYLLGKDPTACDIVFQDLSVSRQHARITIDEMGKLFIEDLGSRNGVLVNGELIKEKREITSQDVIAVGTTTFLIIDREQDSETIFAPSSIEMPKETVSQPAGGLEGEKEEVSERPWKEITISKKHLVFAGFFTFLIFLGILGVFSLFHTESIPVETRNENEVVKETVKRFHDVQFSFNESSGKLFLLGHVLTAVEHQELLYLLQNLHFVREIEDTVVIDEYVYQSMNALLSENPNWRGVVMSAPTPGHFVLRGYLQTIDQATALAEYLNLNFYYLERLDNQVVIETLLYTEIESLLQEKGFSGVTFQLSNGEVVLSGRVDIKTADQFETFVDQLRKIGGIRVIKNLVIFVHEDSSRVDLTSKYQVTGSSKVDGKNDFVVINGRILGLGDVLDGMRISKILPGTVLLEKDGLKFKINYNQQ